MTSPAMTFAEFWRAFVRVSSGRGLVCPTPHREQARYIASVDAGTHAEALLHWAKKSAKSFTAAARGVHHLVADERERDDRLIGIASHDEEQSRIIFVQAQQLIERDPYLSSRVKVTKTEIFYKEECTDERTGGIFTRDHRLRALSRDQTGLHGEPWSLVIRDELWAEPDHSMSEGLIPSPTRVHPEILYCSYSALATMRKAGIPLYDLLERARAQDPTLFYSFIGGAAAAASWQVCPWITEAWVDQQRRIFAASPSRFRRVVLNEEVLGDGDTLLTLAEVQASIDRTLPATPGELGAVYYGGLDLGVSNDHAALVIGHLDPDGKFVVDVCEVWRPTVNQPVDFTAIEDTIIGWNRRLKLDRLNVDQWNAQLLVQRLRNAGVPARQVSVEQTMLNRIITVMKSAFTRRAIRLRPTETYLLEQLEALKILETRTPRRDLLKFAPSGTGPDASQHDDGAVALGLCLVELRDRIGRVVMEEMPHGCNLENDGRIVATNCFLLGGTHVPAGEQMCLKDCPGFVSVKRALDTHHARGGAPLDYRSFVDGGHVAANRFVTHRRFSNWVEDYVT